MERSATTEQRRLRIERVFAPTRLARQAMAATYTVIVPIKVMKWARSEKRTGNADKHTETGPPQEGRCDAAG